MKRKATGRRPRVSLTIRVVAAFVLLFVATLSGVAMLTDFVVGRQLTRQAERHIQDVAASLATERVPLNQAAQHVATVCKSLADEPIPLNESSLPRLSRTLGYGLIVFTEDGEPISTAAPAVTAEAMRQWRQVRGAVRHDRAATFGMVAGGEEYRVAVARRDGQWLMVLATAEPFALNAARLNQLGRTLGYELITLRGGQVDASTLPMATANEIVGRYRLLAARHEAMSHSFEARAGGQEYWVVAHRVPDMLASDRWVMVAADRRHMAAGRAEVLQAVVYVALTGMGLVIVVAYLIALSIAGRARKLAATVSSAFAGPADVQRPVRGDEITVIERSFEDLMARLADYQGQLVANERLAVMGKLSASVVHEIRNPLTAMKLTAQLLETQLPADDPRREGLGVILAEIARLADLCEELLVLSGRRRPKFEPCDAAEIARQTAALLAPQLKQANVRIETDLPAEPLPLAADRNQLRQLLLNLLLNAVEASAAGGRIVLAAAAEPGSVRITVDDWGSGIDPAIARAAAEPLTSTKQTGAGLGLAVCRRIVDNHNGSLTMTNRGDGTRAQVVLPSEPPAAPTATKSAV